MTYAEFDGVPYEDWNAPKDTVKRMLALLEDSGKTIKHLYCLCSRDGQSDWSVTVDKLKALIGTADKTTFAQNNAYVTMDVVVKISGTDVRIFMKNHEAHPIKPSFSVGSLGASYTCT